MRITTRVLTALIVFCLFYNGFDLGAREKEFHRRIVERSTDGGASDAVFVGARCNEQADDPSLTCVSSPSQDAQSSDTLQQPTFFKYSMLCTPNGLHLTARNRSNLRCAVAWLREHHAARILIVGYCDNSGSEVCSAALAERRAEVVHQFLLRLGTGTDQIAGVKAWRNLDRPCPAGATECQRQNRSARMFLTAPAETLN